MAAARRGGFDVVLMDVQMPGTDGVEATQRIRALPFPLCDVPIIAVTAHAMSGTREQYLDAGMDDYVSKPIQPALLISKLTDSVVATKPSPAAHSPDVIPSPASAGAEEASRCLDAAMLESVAEALPKEQFGGFPIRPPARVSSTPHA